MDDDTKAYLAALAAEMQSVIGGAQPAGVSFPPKPPKPPTTDPNT